MGLLLTDVQRDDLRGNVRQRMNAAYTDFGKAGLVCRRIYKGICESPCQWRVCFLMSLWVLRGQGSQGQLGLLPTSAELPAKLSALSYAVRMAALDEKGVEGVFASHKSGEGSHQAE